MFITKQGIKVRINGTICIKYFRRGEIIPITQSENLILISSKAGRKEESIIVTAERNKVIHTLTIIPSGYGPNLYKINSIVPAPIL